VNLSVGQIEALASAAIAEICRFSMDRDGSEIKRRQNMKEWAPDLGSNQGAARMGCGAN